MSREIEKLPEDSSLSDKESFKRVQSRHSWVSQHHLKGVDFHFRTNSGLLQDARHKLDKLHIQKYQRTASELYSKSPTGACCTKPNDGMSKSIGRLKSQELTTGSKNPRPIGPSCCRGKNNSNSTRSSIKERCHSARHVSLNKSNLGVDSMTEKQPRQGQTTLLILGSHKMSTNTVSITRPIVSICKVEALANLVSLSCHDHEEFASTRTKLQSHNDWYVMSTSNYSPQSKLDRMKFAQPENLLMYGRLRKQIGFQIGDICFKTAGPPERSHMGGGKNVRPETHMSQSLAVKFLPHYISEQVRYADQGLESSYAAALSPDRPTIAQGEEHSSAHGKSEFFTKPAECGKTLDAIASTRDTPDVLSIGGPTPSRMDDKRISNIVGNSLSLYHNHKNSQLVPDNEASFSAKSRRIESEISETEIEYVQPVNFVNTVEEIEENLIYDNVGSVLEGEDSFTYTRNEGGSLYDRSEHEEVAIGGDDSENAKLFYSHSISDG